MFRQKNSKEGYQSKGFYLVFGREGSGLRREEVESCNLMSTIPTNGKGGVLSLAMAAAIYLYKLTKGNF